MTADDARQILPRTVDVIEQGISKRLHTGVQIYVSRGGKAIADFAIGEARPEQPMTSGTIMLWLSAGKPVTAVAVALLWERGRLQLDDRIVEHIPEFVQNGKGAVTIRHLLTHTGGFRHVETGWPRRPWDEIIARICDASLEAGWIPGERAGYHVASSWFILGELIRRIDGRPFSAFVREEIFEPLGMRDSWNGMPAERFREYGDRIGFMHYRDRGELKLHPWHTELRCCAASPGGNTRGPIRELGRFYESLLFGTPADGTGVLNTETVAEFTRRHRVDIYDETFQHVVDFGLGFIIDSKHHGAETVPYGYGKYCSPATFGHGGAQSSIGFADPDRGLVVAVVANGMAGEGRHNRRSRAINEAIYVDLGLDCSRVGR